MVTLRRWNAVFNILLIIFLHDVSDVLLPMPKVFTLNFKQFLRQISLIVVNNVDSFVK